MTSGSSSVPFKITVITPTYNRADFLKETIDSVLSQKDPNLEYIILDDGSKDRTADVVKPYLGRLEYFRHDNIGETGTVNKGLLMATGDWVAVINSDDPVLPGWLKMMRKFIVENPQAELIYPDWVRTDAGGNILAAVRQPAYNLYNIIPNKGYPHLNCTIGPGMLVRRRLYERLNGRKDSIKYAADIDFIYRAALETDFVHVAVPLATHREHVAAASSSARGRRMADDVAAALHSAMRSKLYPRDLKDQKFFTLMKAYGLISKAFTGSSKIAEGKYRLLSFTYAFLYFLKCMTGVSKVFFRHIVEAGKNAAKNILKNESLQRFFYRFLMAFLRAVFLRSKPVSVLPQKDFVLIGNGFPPHWSGQAVVLGRILSYFDPQTYAILALQDPNLQPVSGRLKCDYSFLKAVSTTPRFFRNLWAWKKQFQDIVDFLVVHKPSAVVACTGHVTLPFMAFWAAQVVRSRFFFYQFDDYIHQWWSLPGYQRQARYFEKIMSKKTAGVIAPCGELLSELKPRFPKSRMIVVRNPSDKVAEPHVSPAPKPLKKIIFAGSLYNLNKDSFLHLVQAVDEISDYTIQIDLYSGVPQSYIESLGIKSAKVKVHPYVPPDEIHEALKGADLQVICLSHDSGAYPLVKTSATAKLADYLANGKPVLALLPEDSFVADYIRKNECGIVCSAANGSDIKAALDSFFGDAGFAMKASKKAVACAKRDFDPEISANKFKIFLDVTNFKSSAFSPPKGLKDRKDYKILQISALDQPGAQANGFLLHQYYEARGLDAKMIVHHKRSADPQVEELGYGWREVANTLASQVERSRSKHNTLSVMAPRLSSMRAFQEADIIHLQLLHASSFLKWSSLPKLFAGKKIIWTIHDVYMMTGHCVYPLSCPRWQQSCGECPDFSIPFPITKDTTHEMFEVKKNMMAQVRPHIVVGSEWMDDMASRSPILKDLPRTHIPFGTRLDRFKAYSKDFARKSFNIPDDAHVISFRSVPFSRNFKGTDYIHKALELYTPTKPTYLLTFEAVGGLDSLRDKYQFIELGWTENQDLMCMAYSASDVFLMPSIAEAFGLMAIESLACGTPLIVFEGTALPKTANAPHSAIAVPMGDVNALMQAIDDVLNKPGLRDRMSSSGLAHVKGKHDFIKHAEKHLDLYEQIMSEAV